MIPYFNPHYHFRGWAIIVDITSAWFTIFSAFSSLKSKSLHQYYKMNRIQSEVWNHIFLPITQTEEIEIDFVPSSYVGSLTIHSWRNEGNLKLQNMGSVKVVTSRPPRERPWWRSANKSPEITRNTSKISAVVVHFNWWLKM